MGLSQVYFLNAGSGGFHPIPITRTIKEQAPFFQKVLTGKTRLAVFREEESTSHPSPWPWPWPAAMEAERS